jgi:hypothetical protein
MLQFYYVTQRPEGKRALGIPGRRWEDNIKMAHKDIRCEGVAQDKVQRQVAMDTVINIRTVTGAKQNFPLVSILVNETMT